MEQLSAVVSPYVEMGDSSGHIGDPFYRDHACVLLGAIPQQDWSAISEAHQNAECNCHPHIRITPSH
jgi:hypothetical protein